MAAETGVVLSKAAQYSNWLLLSLFFLFVAFSTLDDIIYIDDC